MIYIIEADEGISDTYISYLYAVLEGPKGDLDYLELEFQKTRSVKARKYGPKYLKAFIKWLISAKGFKQLTEREDWTATTIRVE